MTAAALVKALYVTLLGWLGTTLIVTATLGEAWTKSHAGHVVVGSLLVWAAVALAVAR